MRFGGQGRGYCGAEGGQDCGAGGFEVLPEAGLGAAGLRRREADGDDALGERFVGVPGRRGGEQDGAVDFIDGVLTLIAFFAMADGGAGSETAERVRDGLADAADLVEGENPVVLREGEELVFGGRERMERCGRGIDEGAKHAGCGGFARGRRAVED